MIHLVGVPVDKVGVIWPRLDAAYDEACSHLGGLLSKEIILARALHGNGTIWITADDTDTEVTASCFTSELQLSDNRRARVVECVAGKVKFDIFDFRVTLEKRAKEDGCARLYFMMPRRWMPRLPDYHAASVLMCKEL